MHVHVYIRSLTPSRSKARCCKGFGRVVFSNLTDSWFSFTSTVFQLMVARSISKVRKLCTGEPLSVTLVLALRIATAERCAGATIFLAAGGGIGSVMIIEKDWSQAISHLPFHIVGERTEENVALHPVGQAMVYQGAALRSMLFMLRNARSTWLKLLFGPHCFACAQNLFRHALRISISPIESLFVCDGSIVSCKAEALSNQSKSRNAWPP